MEIDRPSSVDAQVTEHSASWVGGEPQRSAVLRELQAMIDGLVEQVALVACDGTILAVNDRWRTEVERQARSGIHISRDYVGFLEGLVEKGDDGARAILNAFHDVAEGKRNRFRCTYIGEGTFTT